MLRTFAVAAVLAGLSTATAADADLKAVAGTWVVEKAELDGQDLTKLMKAYVLTLDGGTYTLDDNGKKDTGTISADGGKSPKELDITPGPDSPLKGKQLKCIYAVNDGRLTVCYGMDFATRPTEFKTAEGSKRMLIVYQAKK